MTRNVLAIVAIFLCTTAAWAILGTTVVARTHLADSGLGSKVASSWGKPQQQAQPTAFIEKKVQREVPETVNGVSVSKVVEHTEMEWLPLERSRVRAALDLEQRQKGLLWFATYRVAFAGDYVFRNDTDSDDVLLQLSFPAPEAIYDDLVFKVNGQPQETHAASGAVQARVQVPVGQTVRLEVGYRSQGMTTWNYAFSEDSREVREIGIKLPTHVEQVRDFQLDMTTDFADIDFPQNTLSPTTKVRAGNGWRLTWKYNNLVTGYGIGMLLPQKIQPGPLVGRISFFAPVSLLFFFFLMFIITRMRGIDLHPMHYFFLATSFFAFHLLLAYLADHLSIHLAFAICSAVSIFLVVSYLRIVVGPRFALIDAALTQLVYLVGFSYAFFFDGFTGLAITIGAIVTLFIVMQMTARVDWRKEPGVPAEAVGSV